MHIHQIVPISDEAMDQLKAMDAPAQSPISTTLAGVAPIQTWMELGQVLPDIGDVDKKILASVGNTNTILMSTTTKDVLATITVSIGTNGHWEVGGVDTGIPATGTSPERVPRPVGLYNAVVLGSANGALVLPAGITYTVADGADYYTLSTTAEIQIPVDLSASLITIDRAGSLRVYPVSTSLWTIPPSQAVLLVRTGHPATHIEQGWLMPTVHNAWVVAASTESFARFAQSAAITAQQAGELAATAVLQANAALAAAQLALNQANDLKVTIEQVKVQVDATAAQLNQMLSEAISLNNQAIANQAAAEQAAVTATTKAGEATTASATAVDKAATATDAATKAEGHETRAAAAAKKTEELVYQAAGGLLPAVSAVFVYTNGLLTQMTEQLAVGERVTTYSYTNGRLTGAVETLGPLVRTTTYTYQAGSLTGFTTIEGGA